MIRKVEYIEDYRLHIVFNDGQERIVDLFPFLSASTIPFISKYLDLSLFKDVKVDYGTVAWGDNDFDKGNNVACNIYSLNINAIDFLPFID